MTAAFDTDIPAGAALAIRSDTATDFVRGFEHRKDLVRLLLSGPALLDEVAKRHPHDVGARNRPPLIDSTHLRRNRVEFFEDVLGDPDVRLSRLSGANQRSLLRRGSRSGHIQVHSTHTVHRAASGRKRDLCVSCMYRSCYTCPEVLIVRTIVLSRGAVAVVDDADHALVAEFKWSLSVSRSARSERRYASRSVRVNGRNVSILMHRQILGADSGQYVDHRDGDGLNNQRENIRTCTPLENARNQVHFRSDGASSFKGVSPSQGRWRATIKLSRRPLHLGLYDTEELAALAYDYAARQAFGDFANCNMPAPDAPPTITRRIKSSRYIGVTLASPGRWRAFIKSPTGLVSLGSFAEEIQAALAYDVAARSARGASARLNFPEGSA